ncbi:hypothetical protein O181_062389 [Austropuccinia psidii MF-1]|uniref:Integrase catalytic domain-containing protein n=1 Tax=Austropuccinia psidii MF-1 TaxID=1389203 RepID=A0A9Q3EK12_9BASI|nr:hypothetical protein [Austropuccinia psidii MF-1]
MDNAREFVSASFTAALSKLGISFYPSLPYLLQENGEAEHLNRTLGDMARAMLAESSMPDRFWQFSYTLAFYLHNRLPNRQCPDSSPHQVLYSRPPLISTLYPFGERAIVHVPAVQPAHKLAARGVERQLLKPLLASGGWLLWDPVGNQMIHLASVIFPCFQKARSEKGSLAKGSLGHVLNTMLLSQVPMELYFECKEKEISSVPLGKDISISENLRQALVSPHQHHWEQACLDELDQMKKRGVWQAINRTPQMKTIGNSWVFDTKLDEYGNIDKFKAQLPGRGDHADGTAHPFHPVSQRKGPTPSKRSLQHEKGRLLLVAALFRDTYKTIIAIWIHIDDSVIASNSPTQIEELHEALCNNFEIKWSDAMKQIVGLEWAFGEGEVTISQTRLTNDIINAYPRKVLQHDCPLLPIPKTTSDEQEAVMEATPFRLVVGLLAYLVSGLRPDLEFAVNYLARHLTAPTMTHWTILNHLVGYLLKTCGHSIVLRPRDCTLNLWRDAGWGGELERSQWGFMLELGKVPILWCSKHQTMVLLSMCATEYIALSDSMKHLVQATKQLTQLAQDIKKTIFCENQAAVQVSIDNLSCKCMRYLDRAFLFVKDIICKHGIVVRWVKTQEMQEDALKKQLSGQSLTQALQYLSITGNR